ncbi:unnamed protein product [Schistosoma intercalatum]|nr:unnamed protein product [Schistosoma intercalatum]
MTLPKSPVFSINPSDWLKGFNFPKRDVSKLTYLKIFDKVVSSHIIFVNKMLHFQTVFWVQLLIISLFYTHKVIISMPIAEELSIECTIQCGVEADKCQKAHATTQPLIEACVQKMFECVKHCTGPPPVEDYYYY